MSKKHNFVTGFAFAGNGIKEAFKNEPNFRFHVLAGILVFLLAFILNFNPLKLALLILTITFVITLELINTEIEQIVDFINPNYSDKAKIIKDLSAASVLLAAGAALLVGLLLFLPDILPLLSFVN